MTQFTLSTVFTILQNLAYAVVFLLAIGAAYLTLKDDRVRTWLKGTQPLVRVVLLLSLAALVYQAVSPVVTDLFAFPRCLISSSASSGFTATTQCLTGIAVLCGLVFASWHLAKEGPGN